METTTVEPDFTYCKGCGFKGYARTMIRDRVLRGVYWCGQACILEYAGVSRDEVRAGEVDRVEEEDR
jgi:hypothetical protein